MTQYDFGGFDPTFFGISLHFSNLRAARLFEASRHSANPLPTDHLPADERFEALSIFSALSHEIRHFHDALLAPYGASVFHRRVQMLVNLLEFLTYMFDEELNPQANCLPVPLERWWRLSEAERAQWISALPPRRDNTPWRPVRIPVFNDRAVDFAPGPRTRSLDSLDELLRAVAQARAQIHDLTFNPQSVRGAASFQPWQVFELSGLLVQLQELWQMYGREEVQFFVDRIMAEDTPYSTALFVGDKLCEIIGVDFNWSVLSLVTEWSLLGSYQQDGWSACPTVRFARLADLLAGEGIDLDRPAQRLFAHWSQRLKLSTVEEGVAEAQATYARIPGKLREQVAGVKGSFVGEELAEMLIRVTLEVAASSALMAEAFLEAPETYVVPRLYISSSDRFVNPALRLVFESLGAVVNATAEELEERGHIVHWAVEKDGQTVMLSYIEPLKLSAFDFVAPKDAALLADLFGLTEFLFSDVGHERSDVQRAGRVFFRESKIEPVQVF